MLSQAMATGATAVATTLAMMTTATTTDTSSTLSTRGHRKFRGYAFLEQSRVASLERHHSSLARGRLSQAMATGATAVATTLAMMTTATTTDT